MEHGVVSDTDQPDSFGAAEQRENIGDRGLRKLSTVDVRLSLGTALWPGEWVGGGAARSGDWQYHPLYGVVGHVLQWHAGATGRTRVYQWRDDSLYPWFYWNSEIRDLRSRHQHLQRRAKYGPWTLVSDCPHFGRWPDNKLRWNR